MEKLTIAVSDGIKPSINSERPIVALNNSDLCEVAAVVLSVADILAGELDKIEQSAFGLPVFAALHNDESLPADYLPRLAGVFTCDDGNQDFYGKQLESAAQKYEAALLPPFFGSLKAYVQQGNAAFDCPGHQGGQFFRRHPSGRQFFDYFGETLFRSDLCNADVSMGDLLIHEGAPCAAQQHAAQVFNADKTYFVLNGTSSSNKVVLNALLTP
ncbi:Orn/Lys/Arg decarboxylase N-terminal domain-containing protein, partial [Edwardsiella tarda]